MKICHIHVIPLRWSKCAHLLLGRSGMWGLEWALILPSDPSSDTGKDGEDGESPRRPSGLPSWAGPGADWADESTGAASCIQIQIIQGKALLQVHSLLALFTGS